MPTLRPTAFGSVRGGLEESDSVLSRKQTFMKFAPLLIAFCWRYFSVSMIIELMDGENKLG